MIRSLIISLIVLLGAAVTVLPLPSFAALCPEGYACTTLEECLDSGRTCDFSDESILACTGAECCCTVDSSGGATSKGIVKYDPDKDLGDAFTSRGASSNLTPGALLQKVAYYALYFLGAVVTGLLIYAGFEWALAGGDKGKIAKARQMILYALIGMAIVLGAYGIAQLVFNTLLGG